MTPRAVLLLVLIGVGLACYAAERARIPEVYLRTAHGEALA